MLDLAIPAPGSYHKKTVQIIRAKRCEFERGWIGDQLCDLGHITLPL